MAECARVFRKMVLCGLVLKMTEGYEGLIDG
jgi:hypothetical protein